MSNKFKVVFNPLDDLSQAPRLGKMNIGRSSKPLLESDIRAAQSKSRSAMEAARVLNVSFNTYKKYAKMYNIFEDLKNQRGIGIPKGFKFASGAFALKDIMMGKHPNYPAWKYKKRLISQNYIEEKCSMCGFEERRIIDYKVPLMIDFIDGNKKNLKIDNIRLLCLNCAFLTNGNIFGTRKLYKGLR